MLLNSLRQRPGFHQKMVAPFRNRKPLLLAQVVYFPSDHGIVVALLPLSLRGDALLRVLILVPLVLGFRSPQIRPRGGVEPFILLCVLQRILDAMPVPSHRFLKGACVPIDKKIIRVDPRHVVHLVRRQFFRFKNRLTRFLIDQRPPVFAEDGFALLRVIKYVGG